MESHIVHYLAGFVDGEGSIGIGAKQIGMSPDGTPRQRWTLRLSVHQVDPRPIRLLAKTFGGSVRRHGYRKMVEKRDLFEWVVVSENAYAAIKALRPYLIVKAEQADVGMEFQELLRSRTLPRSTALQPEEIAARESLYQRIKDMKWQTFYEALPEEEAPMPRKPKPPKKARVKVAAQVRGEWRKGKKPDAEELRAVYEQEGPLALAKRYGTSRQTIYNWLDSYGIPRVGREASEYRRIAALKRSWTTST